MDSLLPEETLLGTIQSMFKDSMDMLRRDLSSNLADMRAENESFRSEIRNELILLSSQISEEKSIDSGNERVSTRDHTKGLRRSSFLSPDGDSVPKSDPKEKYTMSYQPLEITEDMKLKNLTVKGVKWLLTERYPEYLASSIDKTRTIADFISKGILNELVDIQKREGTPVSHMLTYEKIRSIPNDLATDLLAFAIRPENEEDYRNKLLKNVTECKPAKNKNWEFGVQGYDDNLFSVVNKIIEEIVSYDGFFRNKGNNSPPGTIPKLSYGTKDDPGAFRIFLGCFLDYGENFRRFLTDEALKGLKSTNDFAELMRFANEKFAQQARANKRLDSQAKVREPIKDTVDKIQASRMQQKLRDGAALRQLSLRPQLPETTPVKSSVASEASDDLYAVY